MKPCVSITFKKHIFKKHMEKNKHGKKLSVIVWLNKVGWLGWEWVGVNGSRWEWVGVDGSGWEWTGVGGSG